MTTPTKGDVHVNTVLTQISVAYVQRAENFVATRVFPNIPVSKQSDLYWVMDRGSFNRDEMALRAPATESQGGGWSQTTEPYFCPVYAFHHDIDDQRRANSDSVFVPDTEATNYVTMKGLIRREKAFVSKFFKASAWLNGSVGGGAAGSSTFIRWSDYANSTPIEDIREAKRNVMESTGFQPNKLVLGRKVYDRLIDHPDMLDRLNRGQTPGAAAQVTRQNLATLFEVDEVLVMDAVENVAKEGFPPKHQFIGGNHALLVYAPASPSLMTPSGGYTFSWTGYLGATQDGMRIKKFRMEPIASDRIECEMAFDQRMISNDVAWFFADAVA